MISEKYHFFFFNSLRELPNFQDIFLNVCQTDTYIQLPWQSHVPPLPYLLVLILTSSHIQLFSCFSGICLQISISILITLFLYSCLANTYLFEERWGFKCLTASFLISSTIFLIRINQYPVFDWWLYRHWFFSDKCDIIMSFLGQIFVSSKVHIIFFF